MIPGQLGPTSLVLFWVFKISTTRTMSFWGIPSVIQTMRPISAAIASSMEAAATDGGTKIALHDYCTHQLFRVLPRVRLYPP